MTEYLHDLKINEFTDFWLQAKSQLFLNHMPSGAEKRVLDLGSGTGLLTYKLAESGWQVDALEPNPKAVEWIKEKAASYPSRIRVFENTLEEFFPKRKYPAVVMADVLEHIEDDEKALEKISTIMESDGTLLLSVPAHPGLWNAHDEYCKHCRRYRKAELKSKLEKHFRLTDLRYWNVAMVPFALANKIIFRKEYPHKRINSVGWLNELLKQYYLAVENRWNCNLGITLFAIGKKR